GPSYISPPLDVSRSPTACASRNTNYRRLPSRPQYTSLAPTLRCTAFLDILDMHGIGSVWCQNRTEEQHHHCSSSTVPMGRTTRDTGKLPPTRVAFQTPICQLKAYLTASVGNTIPFSSQNTLDNASEAQP
ncbi:unnamed protein product, partial [Ectocarpus fasciculatus]